jgi:hypothetical protein
MYKAFRPMRTFLKTGSIFLLSIFWLPAGIHAQQTNPTAEYLKMFNLPVGMGQVWEGKITFTRNDSKHKDVDNSRPGHTDKVVDTHTVQAGVTIRFCGCGHFYVSDVQRNWAEQWEKGHLKAYERTYCEKDDGTGRKKREPVSPGNEDIDKERGSGALYLKEEEKYDLGPKGAQVSMTPVPVKGGFLLNAMAEVFVNYSSTAESLNTAVCSGKRKSTKSVTTTVPFSKEPQSSMSGGDDSKTFLFEAHPLATKFALVKHVNLADGQETIQGSETLVDVQGEKPGDWNRNMVATWNLRMKNYCKDVFDALYADLAVAEAYNDPNLRNGTGDTKAYRKLVFQQARQTYQSNNPDPDSNTSLHMSANEDCEIVGVEKAKESLRERCLPDVIFDAVYAHERKHVRQCKMDPDMYPPNNVEKLGVYETDAYMAGIRKYISWLELNCPNDNRLAVAKDRLAALKANRTR